MKTVQLTSIIPETLNHKRLDQALASLFPDYSRAILQNWIKQGYVLINGNPWLRPRDKVSTGLLIEITAELQERDQWQAQSIPLSIVHEDDSIIIVNKPPGLIVHPGAGNPENTLVNALLHYAPELDHLPRAGLIHRLDKDTSGLLVIAKTLPAHAALTKAMAAREIYREYEAIVQGVMISGGTVDAPISRHPTQRIKMSIVKNGKPAVTHYRVLEKFRAHTRLQINLETGRTHQIRVHLTSINHPIVGDQTYGKFRIHAKVSEELKKVLQQFPRQALHAKRLTLQHPITHVTLNVEAPTPEDMQVLIEQLRKDAENENAINESIPNS